MSNKNVFFETFLFIAASRYLSLYRIKVNRMNREASKQSLILLLRMEILKKNKKAGIADISNKHCCVFLTPITGILSTSYHFICMFYHVRLAVQLTR